MLSFPVSRSDGPHEEKRKAAFGSRGVSKKSCAENVIYLSACAEKRLVKTMPCVCSGFTYSRETDPSIVRLDPANIEFSVEGLYPVTQII